MTIYDRLFGRNIKPSLWLLIDPDDGTHNALIERAVAAQAQGVGCVLVGGSLITQSDFDGFLRELETELDIPLVIFPGNAGQVSSHADAILFMSLLSGRNPQFLIGEQVISAPLIKKIDLEAISTGYLLIESGTTTAAQFMSATQPIPRHKPALAVAHAQAAELFGMKLIYLEAGSGADQAVPPEMIAAVAKHTKIPVITGGGIREPEAAAAAVYAGARAVVVGTAVEDEGVEILSDMIQAIKLTTR